MASNGNKIWIISPAFGSDPNLTRDLDSSIKTYSGWNIEYYGVGERYKNFLDTKIIKTKKFLDLNKTKSYEWLIIIDCIDSLFIQNFNELDIYKKLESFNKPIIFSGDGAYWPELCFWPLFSNQTSPVKYLCAGLLFIHKSYINILYDYILALHDKEKLSEWNDQHYYYYALFSKEIGHYITIDDKCLLGLSTHYVDDKYIIINNNKLKFCYNDVQNEPYILHCNGADKHHRKRNFMNRLHIL